MFAETLAPGRMIYDCVTLRVQTPVVLRISELKKHLAFIPRTRDSCDWSVSTHEPRIMEAPRMRRSQRHRLTCIPFYSSIPFSASGPPCSLFSSSLDSFCFFLFIPDYRPLQELSLTVLTMALCWTTEEGPLLCHDRRHSPPAGQGMMFKLHGAPACHSS